MNNNFTWRRQLSAIGIWAFMALTAIPGRVFAQCDIIADPMFLTPEIILDPINGTGQINAAVVSGYITSGTCSPFAFRKYRFYSDQDRTTFFPNSTFDTLPGGGIRQAVNFDCDDVGNAYAIWVAINDGSVPFDKNSESEAVAMIVGVIDSTPPQINAPDNITVAADANCRRINIPGVAMSSVPKLVLNPVLAPGTYTDNCLGYVQVGFQIDFGNNGTIDKTVLNNNNAGADTFPTGVTRVIYTVRDRQSNAAQDTFLITVVDSVPPAITCPPSDTVSTGLASCSRAVSNIQPIAVTENCTPIAGISYSISGATTGSDTTDASGTVFNLGVSTVTYTVVDQTMATGTCTFSITVTDSVPPTLANCPATDTVVVYAAPPSGSPDSCAFLVVGTALNVTATDNCTSPQTIVNNISGTATLAGELFNIGTHTIIWTAQDSSGNSSTCEYVLSVADSTLPNVNFARMYDVNVTLFDCAAVVTIDQPDLLDPTGVSDCGPPVLIQRGTPIVNGVPDPNFLNGAPAFNPNLPPQQITVQFPSGTTVIPYTWTDIDNNTQSGTITVIVRDSLPPTAVCRTDTVLLDLEAGSGTTVLSPFVVNDGSTDNCPPVSLSLSKTNFTCADIGLSTVNLIVSDGGGKKDTCSATVRVRDLAAPILQCPQSRTVNAGTNCKTTIPGLNMVLDTVLANLSPGEFFDNAYACGGFVRQYTLAGAETKPYPAPSVSNINGLGIEDFVLGTTTVTIRVFDPSNNVATCSFDVTVEDNTGPQYTGGQAAGTTINANANLGGCIAQVTWTPPTFVDSCSPGVTVMSSHNPGASFPFGPTIVTYTAMDAAGNATLHTFTVNVNDTQAPVANCKDITVSLDGSGNVTIPVQNINNNSTDNCFFSYTVQQYSFTCSNIGPNTVTMTIVDGSNNSASCQSVITVQDVTPPTANCAMLLPISLGANGTAILTAGQVNNNSTDNCGSGGLSFEISVNGSPFGPNYTFDCDDVGVTQNITLRVRDASNNTASCLRSVQVVDLLPPSFMAPANITVECGLVTPDITGRPMNVSDNCLGNLDTLVSDQISNQAPPPCLDRTIIRTWRIVDEAGNSASATQTIVVQDNTLPVFTMTPTIVTETDSQNFCDGPFNAQITQDSVSDNCSDFNDMTVTYEVDYPADGAQYGYFDIPQTSGNIVPGGFFPIGTTKITWRVTDACGNPTTFTQFVVVNDTQGPAYNTPFAARCGTTVNLNTTLGECSSLFVWNRPTNFFSGLGQTDIFECPLSELDLPGGVTETISDPTVQGFINTVSPFVWNVPNPQVLANFPIGTTTITYTAIDGQGNSAVCAFDVVVTDNQQPMVTCPPDQVLPSTCPDAVVPNYLNNSQVMDNCQTDLVLSQLPLPGTSLATLLGGMPMVDDTFDVTITVEDSNPLNTVTCVFTVTLEDGQAPIPAVSFLPPIIGFCGADTIYAPLAIDPCSLNDTIWGTPSIPGQALNTFPPSYLIQAGNYIVTWSYTDGVNTTTQQQLINLLVDNFPPVALCKPSFTVDLDPTGFASLNLSQVDNGSNDPNACGPIVRQLNKTSFTCSDLGANVITLTVTDDAANTATCTTTVTVRDVTPPVLPAIPANVTIQACANIPPPANLNSSDACDTDIDIDLDVVSTQDTIGVDKYNYTITRTWTLTDDSGNSSVGTQTITVQDTQAPQFDASTPDTLIVFTDATRFTCDDTVSVSVTALVTDCATGPDLAITNNRIPAQGGNFSGLLNVGTHSIVFTATDISGNASQHTVVLIVRDGTTPTAACINGVTVALNPSGLVNISALQINANSFDNCTSAPNLTYTVERLDDTLSAPGPIVVYDCDDADGVTQHPVELTVFDAAGNSSSCQTYVIVQDNVNPTITSCPPSKTLDCGDDTSPQIHGQATADDNCLANLTIDFVDTLLAGSGNACVVLSRTWIASDLANNTATCVQNFNIVDTLGPVFSLLPVNDTISCGDTLPALPIVTASDNCADSIILSLVVDTVGVTSGVCGQYNYTVRRTWTAEDGCGNTATHTQLIVVRDTEAPLFVGMPDTLTLFSDSFPNITTCALPLVLDVADYLQDCADISELLVTNNSPYGDTSFNAGGLVPVGNYKFFFSATDPCGNTGVDSVVVNIIDNTTPSVVCISFIEVTLGSNGSATINANQLSLGSSDNCGIDTLELSQTEFDCSDLGINEVVLTAVDVNGNTNSCTVDVEVLPGMINVFSLAVSATPETTLGASNGTATATATGGSGNFVYDWSNNGTTPVITGLPAGTYSVVVTDTITGCVQSDSVVVDAGLKLTLIVGEAGGAWGETVLVPVTVDNFIDIVGFTYTLDVVDPSVGTVIGAVDDNPALGGFLDVNVVGNKLTVFWADPLVQPLDLPNGALLFNLEVTLNNAPLGSISPVNVTGDPVLIEFQQDSAGNIIAVPMITIDNGFVEITDTIPVVNPTIAGDIKTWANPENPSSVEQFVNNVEVSLTGSLTAQITVDSMYDFSVPLNANSIVKPGKVTVGNNGITSADLLRIVNHIFGDTLPSPYMWIAGDINRDNKVSLADYLIIQRLVLGVDSVLLQGPSWRFVPKAHIFPPNSTMPNGPLSAPYPDSISHFPVDMDYLDDDFVAIRMGDVNGNTPVNFQSNAASDRYGSSDALYFRLDDQTLQAGSFIEVPVRTDRFADRQAYQMTLSFDPGVLRFDNALPGTAVTLSAENFGKTHLAEGHLTTNWVDRKATSLQEDETLFTLRFEVLSDAPALSDVLYAGSAVTRAESYTLSGETTPVSLRFMQQNGAESPFILHQNQPNPFDGSTLVRFQLPSAGNATFRVFNANGQVVKTVDSWFGLGLNEIRLTEKELGSAGVYWYELESGSHVARKKMVLIK